MEAESSNKRRWRFIIGRKFDIRGAALFAIVLVVAAAVSHGVIFAPFHFDDHHGIVSNAATRDWKYFLRYWTDPSLFSSRPDAAMYRPAAMKAI